MLATFINLKICTCKKCDDELKCDGKTYTTKNPLTCPLHALAYEIECDICASQVHDIIHPILGRGHSNIHEASHNVLIRFRSKDICLHRLHYITSTNMGLCQSNMTWLIGKKGTQYHWLLDLFRRLQLPLFDGMEEALKKANEDRTKKLQNLQSEESKKAARIALKRRREIEQEVRKQWLQEQEVVHNYGDDDFDELEMEAFDGQKASDLLSQAIVVGALGDSVVSSKKTCKCGSGSHLRTSHLECPLNKNNQVSDSSKTAKGCKCDHIHTSHKHCLFNKHN